MKNERMVLLRFNLLQIFHWCNFGAFAAFVVAFMRDNGMSSTELSLMIAIYMLCAFLGQFFWGSICDKLKTNKKVYILGTILVLAIYYLIFIFAENFSLIMILYPLLGFVQVPLPSNLDTWILKCFYHRPEVYAPSRGWASLGFAVFMLFYGSLISSFGYQIMPMVSTVFALVVVLLAFMQPDSPLPTGQKKGGFKVKDIGKLTKIKPYMFVIFFLLFTGLAISPINSMKIVVLESVGGSVADQGYDSFFMCMFQLPFFFLSTKVRKIPRYTRLFIASIGTMLMVVINFFAVNPAMVIIASVANAIAYSIMLPTVREITEEYVDQSLKTTAHGVVDAVFQSLAGMLSLMYAGTVMDSFGVQPVMLISICLQAITLVLAGIKFISSKKALNSIS